MAIARRWVFRLTPLLDVLLVVLFASLIQSDVDSQRRIEAEQRAREQAEELQQEKEALAEERQKVVDNNMNRIQELESEIHGLQNELKRLEQVDEELQAERSQSEAMIAQLQQLNEIVQRIGTPELAAGIQEAISAAGPSAQRQLERLLSELNEDTLDLSTLVDELMKMSSVRRVMTFWELSLDEEGFFALKGEDGNAFYPPERAETEDQLETYIRRAIEASGEPKSNLMLTFLYNGNAPVRSYALMEAIEVSTRHWIEQRWSTKSGTIIAVGPIRKSD